MNGNATFPGNISVIEAAQRQMALFGRAGATRLIRVPALSAAIAVSVGSGTVSASVNVPWREDGTVIAAYGQELTGTVAKFASTEARIQISGSEDLISDGTNGTFAPFLALFGPNVNWFPFTRRVRSGINWVVTYRNTDAAAVCNPSLMFAFIADADLARMARQGK